VTRPAGPTYAADPQSELQQPAPTFTDNVLELSQEVHDILLIVLHPI
jgi:hypothetical protein